MTDPTTPRKAWISMWTRPRETIQAIVDGDDPERMVLPFAAGLGLAQGLFLAVPKMLAHDGPGLLVGVLGALLGAVAYVLLIYFSAFVLRVAGRWLGGRTEPYQVRAALVWSSVPTQVAAVLTFLAILLLGPMKTAVVSHKPGFFLFESVNGMLGIWTFVLQCKTLGQVQKFSAWRALGSICLASLMVMLMAVPVMIVLAFVGGMGAALWKA